MYEQEKEREHSVELAKRHLQFVPGITLPKKALYYLKSVAAKSSNKLRVAELPSCE
jgi:hypothetical protein